MSGDDRMVISAVPASIPRSRVVSICEELGIDPAKVMRGGIVLGDSSVWCRVFAGDKDGQPYLDAYGEIVTHEINIPIVEDRA